MRGRLAVVGEIFFDAPVPEEPLVDLIRCVQRPSPLAHARCVPFATRVIDLRAEPAQIMAGFDEGTRYELRRAERDDLTDRRWDTVPAEILDEFCDFYDRFTAPLTGSRISRTRMRAHAASGTLRLSSIQRDAPLAWHAYHCAPARARLLHSATIRTLPAPSDPALVSRAHRSLHWRDILYLRDTGLHSYDLGGWSGRDPAMRGIDRFKASFGGAVVHEFNCVLPLTLRGSAAVLAEWGLDLLGRRLRTRRS